jgi:PAS domain S-box-containing protein
VCAAWGVQNNNPTGIPRDDLIGKKLTDFKQETSHSELLINLEWVFNTGESIEHESRASLPGGDFHFELFYSPMRNKEDEITQVLVISRNVTQRIKTEEALRATSDRLRKLEFKRHQAQRLESLGVLAGAIASPPKLAADVIDSVPEEAVKAQGTVLVVDDERAVRTVAGRMLTRGGFDVLTADGGEEAVHLYAENRETICAVVLDATMPNMDGEATYHALRMIRHSVPIVLCTGHSEWDAANILEGKTKVSFLPKPFTLATLTSSVRTALEL